MTTAYKGSLTMDEAKALIRKAGFRVGAGCWENDENVQAFSFETFGRGTYGHARMTVAYHKPTGWVQITK